jgi:hypothetical protein
MPLSRTRLKAWFTWWSSAFARIASRTITSDGRRYPECFFFSILAARLPGTTFFLQTLAFYRAIVVSPASARFPVTMGIRHAIGQNLSAR